MLSFLNLKCACIVVVVVVVEQNMKFGWRIIVGSIIGFLGAALCSVGGVGGGGVLVPMLALISKC